MGLAAALTARAGVSGAGVAVVAAHRGAAARARGADVARGAEVSVVAASNEVGVLAEAPDAGVGRAGVGVFTLPGHAAAGVGLTAGRVQEIVGAGPGFAAVGGARICVVAVEGSADAATAQAALVHGAGAAVLAGRVPGCCALLAVVGGGAVCDAHRLEAGASVVRAARRRSGEAVDAAAGVPGRAGVAVRVARRAAW